MVGAGLYPSYLNPGDNAWQLTAATFVGLMSIPGLVVLYGGVMQKRWSVNSMMLAFVAFAIVLIEWVLYGYKMGFGYPWHGLSHSGFFGNFIGQPGSSLGPKDLQGQGNIPLVGKTDFPQSSLMYFQFVFAAITPILMLGIPDLGWRLLRPEGCGRLLGRLRDPSLRRRLRLRRRGGDRAASRP